MVGVRREVGGQLGRKSSYRANERLVVPFTEIATFGVSGMLMSPVWDVLALKCLWDTKVETSFLFSL